MTNKKTSIVKVLEIGDINYPKLLKETKNPPKKLFYKGDPSLLNAPKISIVGTREASLNARLLTKKVSKILSDNGFVVVSGLARGIDEEAHKGAISEKKCNTIAVLGSGINYCYPKSNEKIYNKLEKCGLIISEFEDKESPKPYYFPMRNRIISGLSYATIVVEAGLKSGSLITAEIAASQGREVFTFPWSINKYNSIGTNKLLKDGAIPLITPYDILEYLKLEKTSDKNNCKDKNISNKKNVKKIFNLKREEQIIYNLIEKEGEITSDEICNILKINIQKTLASLTSLEMKGLIVSEMGKFFILHR